MCRFSGKKCKLITMMFLTITFMLVEIMIGYATNSMALITDSFHMLSDCFALIVAYLSILKSPKQWTKNTFGWARAEVLGALVNAVFLVALCFYICIESFKRFITAEPIHNPILIVYVGALGLFVNILGLFLFHDHSGGHGHSHGSISRIHTHFTQLVSSEAIPIGSDAGNENHDHFNAINNHSDYVPSADQMNIRGVYLHILADALGSVVAIVSALIVWLTEWRIRDYIDPILSLLLVVVILYSTWPLLYESALILLQTVPTHIEVNVLHEKLLKIDGVLAVHEFHVWQLTGDRIIATAHIRCNDLHEYMKLAIKIKEFFHNEGIHSTTIQPEFVLIEVTDDAKQNQTHTEDCVLDCPKIDDVIPCQLQTCCGPLKQSTNVSKEDIQYDNNTSVTMDDIFSKTSLDSEGMALEIIFEEIHE